VLVLALLEMRVALATLSRTFSFERIGERADVEERFAFTMGPRRLRVRVRRRVGFQWRVSDRAAAVESGQSCSPLLGS
jgi:hypothetical protein